MGRLRATDDRLGGVVVSVEVEFDKFTEAMDIIKPFVLDDQFVLINISNSGVTKTITMQTWNDGTVTMAFCHRLKMYDFIARTRKDLVKTFEEAYEYFTKHKKLN